MKKGLKIAKFSPLFILKNALLVFLDVFVMLLTVAIFFGVYAYWKTPGIKELSSSNFSQTSIIYDRTGEHVLYEIHGEENRKVIPGSQIPQNIKLATIAAEDNDFYRHKGIDPIAILRAFKTDVQNSQLQEGASTITQQLARNVFLTRERTFRRKLLEIIFAIKIERNFSKEDILDMYLNQVPYGSNAYGIQSAAEIFFQKNAPDLTLDEAALLAALPNAPTLYSPYGNHTDELVRKQQKILNRLAELNLADPVAVEEAKQINTLGKIAPFSQAIDAPHFVFYVIEQLEQKYGREMVENGGLKIYSTLDYDRQKLGEQIIRDNAATNQKNYNAENAALVSLDVKTGEVLTMVGSKDYFDSSIDGQVNVALRPRQPGSSFKPFAYAAAFEKGYQPETVLYDVPTNFGPDGSGHDYTPSNYDGKFHGLLQMRQALAMSLNIPAVKTLYLAGVQYTIDLAHRLGITTLNDRDRYGLALVLGGGEVKLLDETSGFSAFANDGKRNEPTGILKIIDSQGQTFFENKPQNSRVLDEQVARKINSVLSDNSARTPVFGPNNKLHIPGRTVAAKTGTTQEFRDAWTVGYTPQIATGVWVGNNDNRAMRAGADGSYVAAPIWNQYMTQVLKNYPDQPFIDYDHSDAQKLMQTKMIPKITYFDTKKGKEVSEKKAKKTDADRIEIRIDMPKNFGDSNQIPLVAEMQNNNDPMLERWRQSLHDIKNFSEFLKTGNSNQ